MRATVLAWAACLCVTGATSLRAQQSWPERIGSRVRVNVAADSLGPAHVIIGTLVAVGDSALLIRPRRIRPPETAMEQSVPLSRIQRFEVSTGKSRGTGAKYGGMLGLGAGMLFGFALGDELEDCTSSQLFCLGTSLHVVAGGVLGLGLGAVIGAIVGGGDRWQAQPVPVRVSMAPASDGGFRVAASFVF